MIGNANSIDGLLVRAHEILEGRSESARVDARRILEHVTGRPGEWFVAHGDAELSSIDAKRFVALCQRRSTGVPVPYLTASAHFYGREFFVSEAVMLPRPETEHLVDEALRFIENRSLHVLEVGTGSGAIACSIAAETPAVVDATDISAEAIEVARRNARRVGVMARCSFHHGDLVEPVRGRRYDLVVANLPYIPTNDLPKKPNSAAFEPRLALDGGNDGLALYSRLLPNLPPLMNQSGMILVEAAPPTIDALEALACRSLPDYMVLVRKDYAKLARYLRAAR